MFPLHDDNPISRTPVVTIGIIVVNTLVFLFMLSLPPEERQELVFHRGFVPARIAQLGHEKPIVIQFPAQRAQGAPAPAAAAPDRIVLEAAPSQILLSLVTCMFMHGGWFHLIGNMWFLWVFGNNVEDRLGYVPFVLFYLVGGLAATVGHWSTAAQGPGSLVPVIGASGAVAAVLGAYAVTWPGARVHTLVILIIFITIIDLPALLVLGIWFVGQLLEARRAVDLGMSGGVAWWAHVGGFVAGMVMMPIMAAAVGPPGRRRSAARLPDADRDL